MGLVDSLPALTSNPGRLSTRPIGPTRLP